ncbi:MAG TPA: hypothetical protein VK013_08150 [Myxococcaceae bacterium]|nr:hypothetical protein [Myxococcaceae bacterium]
MPTHVGSQESGALDVAPRRFTHPSAQGAEQGVLLALLESGWLSSLYPLGRTHGLRALELTLEPGGVIRILLNGVHLLPEQLEAVVSGTHRMGEDGLWLDGQRWSRLLDRVPSATLDLFQQPGGWRLHVAGGTWLGRPTPLNRSHPPAGVDPHALRLSLFPDPQATRMRPVRATSTEVTLEVLLEQARMLALLVPGLQVTLRAPALGLTRRACAPHGLVQRVEELSYGQRTVLSQPLFFTACWQGLRARCAVQWTEDGRTRIEAFEDGERVGLGDPATTVLTHMLRAGVQLCTRRPLSDIPLPRVLRGLTAVVAIDRVRVPQCSDCVRGSVGPDGPRLLGPAFVSEAVMELAPMGAEAFACHPERERLMSWLLDELPLQAS